MPRVATVTELPSQSRRLQAYHAIRELIVSTELAPESSFTEGQLAGRLGMSTMPVREALLLLAGHHLVAARHGAGYTVAPVTADSVRDAFRVRALLEGEAAILAARHDPIRTAEHLREIEAGSAFHLHIARHSGNLRLLRDLESALLETERSERFVGIDLMRIDRAPVIDAISGGASGTAKALVRRHLHAAEKAVVAAM